MREAISRTFFRQLMGAGPNAVIQRLTELEKSAGDVIKYDLLYQMEQEGVEGDNPIAGFEEGMTYKQDSVKIDQRRIAHAFRRMSQQRTIHDLRKDARENLADRWAVILDQIMFSQLAGLTGDVAGAPSAALAAHGGNTLVVPTSDTAHYKNDNTAVLDLTHIELMLEWANTNNPLIRPANTPWGTPYVLIVHPISVYDLRTSTGATDWLALTSAAYQGRGDKTPLHAYEVGRWGDVMILASRYIPRTTSGTVAHCLFLGAQAGVCAFGNAYPKVRQSSMGGGAFMSWSERVDDYGNEMGVAGGAVFGMKPCTFDSKDGGSTDLRFGMIRLDVKAAAH
jgi:N4-gp56 family major capsid protein